MSDGIGDRFQKETKYIRGELRGKSILWHPKPETYKRYPSSMRISLAPPEKEGGAPLWQVIKRRRSVREFKNVPLKSQHLSQILWASQGITMKYMGYELRATPSAGALYPVETYLGLNNVEGIEKGIYHYDVQNHALELIKSGDFGKALAKAALDQEMCKEASTVFIWTAIFSRSKWKYDERAYRYVYLDAGHIAQNVALASVALGLGSCQIAALYDDEVNALIEVDGKEESVLYMTVIGHPR